MPENIYLVILMRHMQKNSVKTFNKKFA